MTTIDGPEAWHRASNPAASALTWAGSDSLTGHLPLEELRARATASVAEAEQELARLTDEVLAATRRLDDAKRERDLFYNRRQEARERYRHARAVLLNLFPIPPEEPGVPD